MKKGSATTFLITLLPKNYPAHMSTDFLNFCKKFKQSRLIKRCYKVAL